MKDEVRFSYVSINEELYSSLTTERQTLLRILRTSSLTFRRSRYALPPLLNGISSDSVRQVTSYLTKTLWLA